MSGEEFVRDLMVVNRRGLHARAAAKFVHCAEQFDAAVTVAKDGHAVGGRSIMGLMMLTASLGTTIRVAASGPDAEAALDALAALVAGQFGEGE